VKGSAVVERRLEPEIIDGINADHPWAVRSRRDLRLVNFLMGNERWILRQIRRFPEAARRGIVELGAGGGELLRSLAKHGPATGYDLAPRPARLPAAVTWRQGDFRQWAGEIRGGVMVANLFLHHLSDDELARLGSLADRFRVLLFTEPHRSEEALWMADRILPLVGEATRHDMPASIRAGFLERELPEALGLGPDWRVREQPTWRGGNRVLAWRDAAAEGARPAAVTSGS
jgi:hypothetical protein